MLQRITEDFEYYKILDKAAAAETTEEQVALVAAFSVSSYASTLSEQPNHLIHFLV